MVIIAVVGVLAVAATATQALSIGTQSSAAAAASTKAVGALFSRSPQGKLGTHFCTGTVVHSPSGDVVVTAAHCLSGQRPGSLSIKPGYHHGVAPLGVWVVKKLAVDPRWAHAEDPDHDFAFLVVARAGSHSSLEALTGAEQMRIVDRPESEPPLSATRPLRITRSNARNPFAPSRPLNSSSTATAIRTARAAAPSSSTPTPSLASEPSSA
jgi:hypothetical protein